MSEQDAEPDPAENAAEPGSQARGLASRYGTERIPTDQDLRYNWERQEVHGMDTQYTAIVKRQGDWWIGWIEEVAGVNCQERTRKDLLQTLRVTLQEAIEFNRQEAKGSAGTEYEEERIAVSE